MNEKLKEIFVVKRGAIDYLGIYSDNIMNHKRGSFCWVTLYSVYTCRFSSYSDAVNAIEKLEGYDMTLFNIEKLFQKNGR